MELFLTRVDAFTDGRDRAECTATLDSRGRVVIPASVRDKLDLEQGQQLRLRVEVVGDDRR
jgi:AbrB family looped-hinge helix DNA binding protein